MTVSPDDRIPALDGRFFDLAPGPAEVQKTRICAPLLLHGQATQYHLRIIRTTLAAVVLHRMSRLERSKDGDIRFCSFDRDAFRFEAVQLRDQCQPEDLPACAWRLAQDLLLDTRATMGFDGWGNAPLFWKVLSLAVRCAGPRGGKIVGAMATGAASAEVSWSLETAGSSGAPSTPELLRLTDALLDLFRPRGAKLTTSQYGLLRIEPFRESRTMEPALSAHDAMSARRRMLAFAEDLPEPHRTAIRGILLQGDPHANA